ncbi:Alpha/Beta hydrolase protein [Phyllosticta citribraziliensis]|uniref:Alpha/Beta hydrolase protein n=1 Tax=Phyllosticta citribraziliensis TaxID=989973 RepID=A0ABR1L665_9PEZI
MTILFFNSRHKQPKQPAHAPGWPQQEKHTHRPPTPQRPQTSQHAGHGHSQPLPAQNIAHHHVPLQDSKVDHDVSFNPPEIEISPPTPAPTIHQLGPPPASSPPPMYHAHSSPAWIPPPTEPYQTSQYQHQPDSWGGNNQVYSASWQAPPPTPSPPPPTILYAAPPYTPPTGLEKKPSRRFGSQSISNLNQAYKQKKNAATQSVANLNQGLKQKQNWATSSVTNLGESITYQCCSKTNEYICHTLALCDLISSKLDSVINSIDEEVFSGNHDEMVIYEHPQHAHSGSQEHFNQQVITVGGSGQNVSETASKQNRFSKVWHYANSRLPPHLPPFKVFVETYPLLCLAAQYSEKVYHKPTGGERETHVEPDWKRGTKAMVIKSVPLDDMNTVVFAIRGSAGFMDWAVNFRPAPSSPEGFLDDPGNLVHSGFLYTAKNMVKPVAARLRHILQENPRRASCSLLITGHSAGGAVAALLYTHMMSMTVKSELTSLNDCFKRVHCVTFGAPPISLIPLKKPPSDQKRHHKSLFYSFINEGDLVSRADKEVIKNLLRLLATPAPLSNGSCSDLAALSKLSLSSSNLKKPKHSKSSSTPALSTSLKPLWDVPPGTLSCAGRLILLREKSAQSQQSLGQPYTSAVGEVEACVIEDDMLRRAVFGDPMCHLMTLYARRIEELAHRAVTAGGMR